MRDIFLTRWTRVSIDALKSSAYMRYMRILFLIATSRTDYDTLRDLYTRTHVRTPIPPKVGSKPDCATFRRKREAIPNSFLNYRSFRCRGRLGRDVLIAWPRGTFAWGEDKPGTAGNLDGMRIEIHLGPRYMLSCVKASILNRERAGLRRRDLVA